MSISDVLVCLRDGARTAIVVRRRHDEVVIGFFTITYALHRDRIEREMFDDLGEQERPDVFVVCRVNSWALPVLPTYPATGGMQAARGEPVTSFRSRNCHRHR